MASVLKFDQWQSTSGVPVGNILQVVSGNYTSDTTISSSTPTSYISLNITPKSVTSKIWIIANVSSVASNGATSSEGEFRVYKNGTYYFNVDGLACYGPGFNANWRGIGSVVGMYLDSPATVTTINYALYISVYNGSLRFNTEVGGTIGGGTNLTLMEVAV
jgi:hypothetical protein